MCVYSNDGSGGDYHVTFTSSEGSFKLVNGTDEIPYTVRYHMNDAPGGNLATYKLIILS